MRRGVSAVLLSVLLVGVASIGLAQATQPSVKVTVSPEKVNNVYTGRYVAKVEVVGAGSAREVVANIRIPVAYTMSAEPDNISIKDVKAGADVYSVQVDGVPTGVCFVEAASDSQVNSIWVVALLSEENKDPKHVCDILFTARGRPTTAQIAWGEVVAKDGNLAELTKQGTYGSTRCPLFGDLDWDGAIGLRDFGLFVAALRQGTDVAWADLMPLAQGSPPASDPTRAVSAGDGKVGIQDFGAWVMALRNAPAK
ncbi:MAG: hypothetical protein H5T86_12290 [Armatimonadetes bacterium]|nr:hypothetical protein [Armatimonadota bacterium]